MDYNAHIEIYIDGLREHRKYIRNVGSMQNSKHHATQFAKEHGFKGIGNWEVSRSSGMYGSWESGAVRIFVNGEGQQAKIKIQRA
jgi:hypothetical protein